MCLPNGIVSVSSRIGHKTIKIQTVLTPFLGSNDEIYKSDGVIARVAWVQQGVGRDGGAVPTGMAHLRVFRFRRDGHLTLHQGIELNIRGF